MDFKKNWKFILLGFVIFGFILRFLYFSELTFGYDQARDAFEALSIIKNHDIKIIGPTTDIRGLFHSPVFWYIISPFYYLSGGNPAIARIPMIIINVLNILFIYFVTKKLFGDKRIALLSSFFMAVSFEVIQYGRWLSNPPPALLTIGIFFFGFWLVLEKKKIGLPLMIVAWGFSAAFQFFLVYQIIFIFFGFGYLLITSKKTIGESIKRYYWLYLATLIPLSFYILAQIKFRFMGIFSLLSFLTSSGRQTLAYFPKFINFVNSLVKNTSNLISGGNISVARAYLAFLIFFVAYFIFFKKDKFSKSLKFLFIWFISPLPIYFLEKNNSYFLNIGNIYPLIILTTFMIFELAKKLGKFANIFIILSVFAITTVNLFSVINKNVNFLPHFSLRLAQIIGSFL